MKTLSLGISDFAIPSPRTGSISAHSGYGGLPNRGSAIHAEIQVRRMTEMPGYTPERWITHTFELEKHRITVSGRMDGFLFGAPAFIEEIKTAYNVEELLATLEAQPHHPYKLQLRTYGYLQWLASTRLEPRLNLHIVNARTRAARDLPVELDLADYEAWLQLRLRELVDEHTSFTKLWRRRKKQAEAFTFPFPAPRPGQRELIATIEQGLNGGGRLLLQAPTGLGKTAGVLFPTLRDSMQRGQKSIYLTAKNSQHEVAEDAVKRLQDTGVKLRSLTIHAKAKMCLKDEPHCSPEYCEFARDHYTKVSCNGLASVLRKKKRLRGSTFRRLGREFEVCPFELQFEALDHADVVVCDYNYVFSPRNSVGRLTHNGWTQSKSRPNLIVDEVHNLPARAADYFSATLSAETLRELCVEAPEDVRTIAVAVLDELRKVCESLAAGNPSANPRLIELGPTQFAPILSRAQELMAAYLESDNELQPQDPVLRLSNQVSEFAQALEAANEDFFLTMTPSPSGGVLKITCCSAAPWLRQVYDQFANVVGFSATCKPFDYYARLLGLDGDKLRTSEFESPFPRQRRKVLLIPQISTKMRDRPANYGKIKSAIERIVAVKPGNYFVFFPSFDFMNRVFKEVQLPGFRLIAQAREMRREAVAEHLELLKEGIPTVIFAVQGGVFAEGVDYPGDMLIGALIVGPALPTFDFERELLRGYFEKKYGHGFDYAYTYPAMARVVQSAGRVIRSPEDRGLLVLMDRRFTEKAYQNSMPQDWLADERLVSQQILADVKSFWEEGES